ncbi:MAG: hypothetical protein CTY18_07955 [Methylomonas sp.]|nr:MAG: hypothetical protein CTY24_02915 [Methylobacter sp.]PPD34636.1 MAG: hypothetical protein CTY18_07955 [Methylomonas sp.]
MNQRRVVQPIDINNEHDAIGVQKAITVAAEKIGFSSRQRDDIIFAVAYLARYIVECTAYGSVKFEPIDDTGKSGLLICVIGYGVRQFSMDFSAVSQRFDGFEIRRLGEGQSGLSITAKKWLNTTQDSRWQQYYLDTGVVTYAKPGEELNGDTYFVESGEGKGLIAVIDGLGHGEQACKAAQNASEYIKDHADQGLQALFSGVNKECQSTHGVVMAIAHLDWRLGKLAFASVGNIEAKILKQQEKIHLPAVRGFIGRVAPVPKVVNMEWNPEWILVLHSDGVSKNWQSHDFAYLFDKRAQPMAEHMYQKLHLEHDDATILVAKVSRYEKHQP